VATPQQMGSAITYARRYALMAVTGVFPSNEDDDGKAASGAPAYRRDSWDDAQPRTTQRPAGNRTEVITKARGAIAAASTVETLAQIRELVDARAVNGPLTDDDAMTLYAEVNAREAELVGNQTDADGKPILPPVPPSPPIRDDQRRKMFGLFSKLGLDDRAKQMVVIRELVDREIESRTELTSAEAMGVIADLEERVKQQGKANGHANGREAVTV
jgi:hypothetical protein